MPSTSTREMQTSPSASIDPSRRCPNKKPAWDGSVLTSRISPSIFDENGSSLAEFAISVLTLLMVSFAVFEFCMVVYTYAILGNAAREGVRYAIVHGSDSSICSGPSTGCGDSTGSNVSAVVNNFAAGSFHNISAMTVTPSWPASSSQPGSRVKIQVTYTYVPYIKIPGGVTPTMSLTAEGRIVY